MIFDMTLYKPTALEMWICQKYLDNGIMTPADMDIGQIGEIFETFITYKDGGKTKVLYDDTPGAMVFFNIHDSESTQRLKFFHELGIRPCIPVVSTECRAYSLNYRKPKPEHFNCTQQCNIISWQKLRLVTPTTNTITCWKSCSGSPRP